MSKILIIAEHDGDTLNPGTAKAVSCAKAITESAGGDIDILVLGDNIADVASQAAAIDGVATVHATSAAHLAAPLAANWAAEIAAAAEGYSHVLAPSSTFGKDVLPRAAALLGVNMVSDIASVDGERSFKRPVYAGNAIAEVSVPDGDTVVATARTASWPAATEGGNATINERPAETEDAGHTRYVGLESGGGDRPDLQTARIVLSGGRAFGSAENFEQLYTVADKLKAGVGASRAAVDAGYVPNDMQVGQTGKIIAPELYMAFGISGAIQHITGIKDAGTIVAVNKDADAPIFEIADIGLVADLFKVLPELEQQLG
ncbi:electron transfer flavoprotein subunit alpha/FixB family protein [Marinihelvus fidelis]|uniref:Electron transfer flavoprotein subunit alpha n=1 Tax=Marinihelvus fidelis TaxID=2613842 RepID=A0A5N0T3P1_9GAMM|nr:FAD-binding protein [Marinihelvus fidelis]KAA9129685.1 electron transfer flavoprotein subunit alpha/FixB family protein [Marinihelvus fidelis]